MRIIDLLAPNIRSELFEMSNGVKHCRNIKTSHRLFIWLLTMREIKGLIGRDNNGKSKRNQNSFRII